MSSHKLITVPLALAAIVAAPPVAAQSAARLSFRLEPMALDAALLTVARLSGRQILFASELVAGKRAPRLTGRYTALEAVRRLLAGSGLTIRDEAGALLVVAQNRTVDQSAEILVTGSRIRGAQSYAPLTSVSRDTLRSQGQTDLGEAVRTLPQNFGGGQNPYIGLGAEDFGSDNLNSGSSVNLRGLGADATLTLLNGRRIAYDGVLEGVDISAIPFAAVDRLEVVADGASAIYGSDAVAGVVNVVLRRDYSGLQTSARIGGATGGGDVQQQYEAVAGTTWTGGGLVASVSFDRNSAITADQRRFSETLDATTTILPRSRHLAAVVSGYQKVGSRVELGLDALYSRRTSFSSFPNTATGNYLESGIDRRPEAESVSAAPVIKVDLGKDWQATIAGTYARDATHYRTRYFSSGAIAADYRGSYVNRSASAEVSAEGIVKALPGGNARLALGSGYRTVGLTSRRSSGTAVTTDIDGSRRSYFAFGELNVPLVGNANRRAGLERLSANVAGRFEHYPQIGDVFTPKFGLIYAPTAFLELRGTWGRSFKAPTLFQLYQAQGALLYTADVFGGVGYPANAAGLYAYGGNPDLRPQRATSWSAGAVLTPFADRRLTIEATYFKTVYTDRILAPITSATTALGDPTIADLVQLNPSGATIGTLLAGIPLGLVDYSGVPYNPANVVAIIDNRNRNVASQHIDGIDVSASWRIPAGAASSVSLNASATYLGSRQQISPGQPSQRLAGRIFQPAKFRGRGGASYAGGGFTASAFATITGGVEDDRYTPIDPVRGQTSVDLAAGYSVPATTGPLRGVSFQLTALNVLDDLPSRIRTAYAFYTPFDAANYSPVGRLLSLTVAKRW